MSVANIELFFNKIQTASMFINSLHKRAAVLVFSKTKNSQMKQKNKTLNNQPPESKHIISAWRSTIEWR